MLSGGAEVSLAGCCGFWNSGLYSLHPAQGAGFVGRMALGVAGSVGRRKCSWNLSLLQSGKEQELWGLGHLGLRTRTSPSPGRHAWRSPAWPTEGHRLLDVAVPLLPGFFSLPGRLGWGLLRGAMGWSQNLVWGSCAQDPYLNDTHKQGAFHTPRGYEFVGLLFCLLHSVTSIIQGLWVDGHAWRCPCGPQQERPHTCELSVTGQMQVLAVLFFLELR